MVAAQRTTTPGRPWHLWVVGILGGLWSAIGVVSFILTQMNAEAVMSRFPAQQREYFASFPWWADAIWAIGVFAGIIGCLLLLLTNRLAVPVLLASLIGATVANLGGLFLLGGMEVMRETGGLGFTVIPIIFGAFLAYYARAMSKKGVLSWRAAATKASICSTTSRGADEEIMGAGDLRHPPALGQSSEPS